MPETMNALNGLFGAAVAVADGHVKVNDPKALASEAMDRLVRAAVFEDDRIKAHARWLLW